MAAQVLDRLVLHGEEHVLDVGCGDGKITARIAERVAHGSVVGVDPSRTMIEHAAARFGSPAWPNLRFEVGDARTLPYRDAFDLVVSFNALHWVPEMEQALASIRLALRPGGRAVLRHVGAGERPSLEDVVEQVRRDPRWAGWFDAFHQPHAHLTPERYQELAREAGLRVVSCELFDDRWDFGSGEAFAAFCRAIFAAWTARLPEAEHEAFIADVLARYRATITRTASEANTFRFYQMETVLQR
jgi:SAM-dependent methyltransferase